MAITQAWNRSRLYAAIAVTFAFLVALYAQIAVVSNPYLVNDDVCQHIWWMRIFREPGLFQNDLLARYALGLQHFGLLGFYRIAANWIDPVALTLALPLILLPLTCYCAFRIVHHISGDYRIALFAAATLAVTKIYLQHMTGGQAHSFGYPLLAAFLLCFLKRRWTRAALALALASIVFPVVFALGSLTWLIVFVSYGNSAVTWPSKPDGGGRSLAAALVFGAAMLLAKFVLFSDPLIGNPLTRSAVEHMPELTAAGRWQVWPVENIAAASLKFLEEGAFIFRSLWKSPLPDAVKSAVLGTHVLVGVLFLLALVWWFRRRREYLRRIILPALAASVAFYFLSSAALLKLYAPDRYLSYALPLLMLIATAVFVGDVVNGLSRPATRNLAWGCLALMVLSAVPLVKNAGLQDYSAQRELYEYLAQLPRDVVIAAPPELADGIPLFSKRTVFLNRELSVPLYDRYWQTITERTQAFFKAYYAQDLRDVRAFMTQNGITHLVLDRTEFSREKIAAGAYFEPFASGIRRETAGRKSFALETAPEDICNFRRGPVCVIDRAGLDMILRETHSSTKE